MAWLIKAEGRDAYGHDYYLAIGRWHRDSELHVTTLEVKESLKVFESKKEADDFLANRRERYPSWTVGRFEVVELEKLE
jgi:hypothetical protein